MICATPALPCPAWKLEVAEPPELFELLPQAARRRAGATSAMTVRRATRDDRVDAIKVCPLSEVGIGVETKNEGCRRGLANVNDT
jgi:hypothetical protein